jgi:AraC-like DNA-binding protein
MLSDSDPLHIAVPIAERCSSVSSRRYSWDNSRRGNDCFVIIQRTRTGVGIFRWESQTWEIPAGHAFIAIVPEVSSYYYPPVSDAPWEFGWLNFYGSLGVRLCRDFRDAHGAVLPLPDGSAANALFQGLIVQAERHVVQEPCDVSSACFLFLMEWKRLLDAPARGESNLVKKAQRICQTRFREPIGIKELAAQTGLSREHFTRVFTEKTGVSPGRYLRELRVSAARGLVTEHPGTLKETARRCGFPSAKALKRALA